MNKKIILFMSLFFFFLITPITVKAKTYYILTNEEGHPIIDEAHHYLTESEVGNIVPGDIIFCAPNKYEVISIEEYDYRSDRYKINCKCLINKEKHNGVGYIDKWHTFNASNHIYATELDKKSLDGYKKIKRLSICFDVIPSWINNKVKKLTKLKISFGTKVSKNAFANYNKLKEVTLDYTCQLEKNSFKNVKATVYYDNAITAYDKENGTYYTQQKSTSKVKKELKKAGFKKGTIVYLWNGKWSNKYVLAKKYKKIVL